LSKTKNEDFFKWLINDKKISSIHASRYNGVITLYLEQYKDVNIDNIKDFYFSYLEENTAKLSKSLVVASLKKYIEFKNLDINLTVYTFEPSKKIKPRFFIRLDKKKNPIELCFKQL